MKKQETDDLKAHFNQDSIAMGEYSQATAKSYIHQEIVNQLSNLRGHTKVTKLYMLIKHFKEDIEDMRNGWDFEHRLKALNELDTAFKNVLTDKDLQELPNIDQIYLKVGSLFSISVHKLLNSISAEVNNSAHYSRDNKRLDHIEKLKGAVNQLQDYFLEAYKLETGASFDFSSNYPEGNAGSALEYVAKILQQITTMYNTENKKYDSSATCITQFNHEDNTTIDPAGEVKNPEEDQE